MKTMPKNWRDRMPEPREYYARALQKLTKANATGWAQACCPFHEDKNPSLSVNVEGDRGAWRCLAGCGGGDLVGFHMRLHGMEFREAVLDLLGGGA